MTIALRPLRPVRPLLRKDADQLGLFGDVTPVKATAKAKARAKLYGNVAAPVVPKPKAAPKPTATPGKKPKEGDTRTNRAGNKEVLRGGRWRLADNPQMIAKDKPAAIVPVVEDLREADLVDEALPQVMPEDEPEITLEDLQEPGEEAPVEAGEMAGEEVKDDDINLLESSKRNDAIKQEALKNSEYGRLYLDMMQALDKRYERNKAAFEKRTGRKFSEYDIIAPKNVAKSKRAKNYELAKDLIQRRFNHGLPLLASKDFKPTAEGGNRDDSFHGLNSFLEKFWTRAVSTKDDFRPLFRKMQLEANNLERETQSEDTSEPEKPKYESWLEWAESPEAQAISPKAVKIGLFANSNRFNDIAYGVNQGSWSEREATNVINALVEGGYLENHKLDRWNRDKRSIAAPAPTPTLTPKPMPEEAEEMAGDAPKPAEDAIQFDTTAEPLTKKQDVMNLAEQVSEKIKGMQVSLTLEGGLKYDVTIAGAKVLDLGKGQYLVAAKISEGKITRANGSTRDLTGTLDPQIARNIYTTAVGLPLDSIRGGKMTAYRVDGIGGITATGKILTTAGSAKKVKLDLGRQAVDYPLRAEPEPMPEEAGGMAGEDAPVEAEGMVEPEREKFADEVAGETLEESQSSSEKGEPSSNRLKILQNSLKKKQEAFDRKLTGHMDDVRGAQGEPMGGHRRGEAILRRWDKQNDVLRNMQKEIEKTQRAIEIEERKIRDTEYAKSEFPSFLIDRLEAGDLVQWRKHPNTFFMPGVDKARIVWHPDEKTITHRYVNEIKDREQFAKFRDTFNSMNQTLREKESAGFEIVQQALKSGEPIETGTWIGRAIVRKINKPTKTQPMGSIQLEAIDPAVIAKLAEVRKPNGKITLDGGVISRGAGILTPEPTLTKSLRPYPGLYLTLLGVRYILDGGILRKAGMSWEDFRCEAEAMHKEAQGDDDPCWKGYEAVGLKRKGKRMVPNCVPVSR